MSPNKPRIDSWATWLVLIGIGALVGSLGMYGVLVCFGVVYLIVCLARPPVGLAWAFALLPLASPSFQVAGISVQPFEVLVWPACLIALAWTSEKRRLITNAELRRLGPLLAIGGYLMVASFLLWGNTAPLELRMWGSSLLFGVACYHAAGHDDFQRHLRWAFTISAIMLCLLALSQHFFAFPAFHGLEEPRDLIRLLIFGDREPVRLANLSFEHFNSAGAYLTLVVGVLFGLSVDDGRARASRLALLAALVALYFTYSRGAIIAATTGVVLATALLLRARWRLPLVAGTAAVGLLLVLIVLPVLLLSDYALTVSLGSRALIWQAYIQAWQSSPLFGLGPGGGFASAQFLSPFGDLYASHSNFLYLAADFGIIGVLVAVYGFGSVVVRSFRLDLTARRRPYVLGSTAVVTALVVHSLFDHTLVVFPYRVALFGIVALGLSTQLESSNALSHQSTRSI